MTNTHPEPDNATVAVIQSDRDAAAKLYEWFPTLSSSREEADKTSTFISGGSADGWNTVRLMRDHRRQSTAELEQRVKDLEGVVRANIATLQESKRRLIRMNKSTHEIHLAIMESYATLSKTTHAISVEERE